MLNNSAAWQGETMLFFFLDELSLIIFVAFYLLP